MPLFIRDAVIAQINIIGIERPVHLLAGLLIDIVRVTGIRRAIIHTVIIVIIVLVITGGLFFLPIRPAEITFNAVR